MKRICKKINVNYVAVVVLFALSLCFSSTREAHVLCARLLLHISRETFVQGQPPGCVIQTLPNVQFTEKRRQDLRVRSTNSLEDFMLANATGDYSGVEAPAAEAAWSNHPLLEWAALRLTWISCREYSHLNSTNSFETNAVAMAAVKNARLTLQYALTASPTNGALWLAEAYICFAEGQNQAALHALQIAATNPIWSAALEAEFLFIKELLHNAGLSELDAAIGANRQLSDTSALEIQGRCSRSIGQLMLVAVNENNDRQFTMLLQLLVQLRRAEWSCRSEFTFNSFRRFRFGNDLINGMAKQMGKEPLPESDGLPYEQFHKTQEQVRELREQIFQGYLNQHADPITVARFLTQSEDYKTEKALRLENRQLHFQSTMWAWLYTNLAGVGAILALSSLAIAFLFEIVIWALRQYSNPSGKLPRHGRFWITASLVVIASTAVFANFWIACGIGSKGGFGPVEPPPLISPNLQGLLLALLLCSAWFSVLFLDWKNSKSPIKPYLLTLFFAFVYLAFVFAMAYFRFESAEKIAAALL